MARSLCHCGKLVAGKGLCDKHYKRWNREHVAGFRGRESLQRRLWTDANREKHRAAQRTALKKRVKRHKDLCYAAYGGYVCKCCGVAIPEFLTLDHVHRDGNVHRKTFDRRGGEIYRWIINHDFPVDMFQVLCFNCNCGRDRNGGVCPHKKETECQEKIY